MDLACFTNAGCAVYIPLTSVQISKNSASSAHAVIDAVRSEPPRPSVVTMPSAFLETKPGRITTWFLLLLKNARRFALVIL